MSEQEQDANKSPDEVHPHEETLPEHSTTAGEASLKKGNVETDEAKPGKGGEHPTPGAGEHDDPSN